MDGGSKPGPVTPGLGQTSTRSGPLLSDPLKEAHSQADSILTAARLVRRGWTEEAKKKTGLPFSYFDFSRQPSSSDGKQGPKRPEICPKDPGSRRGPVVNNGRSAEDRETVSDKKPDEAKQTEGSFSANRQADRQTPYGLTGVRVLVSGCRNTCRQSRRFKAPILPVIAEM